MQNASLTFGFLTPKFEFRRAICFTYLKALEDALYRGIVKKYTADLILLNQFKKIICIKEKFAQNIEVHQFHLWSFYSKHKRALMDFFCLTFTFY